MFCPRCGTVAAGGAGPCGRCGSTLARPQTDQADPPAVRAPTNRGEAAQRAAGIEAQSLPKAPIRPRPTALPEAWKPALGGAPPAPGAVPAGSQPDYPPPQPHHPQPHYPAPQPHHPAPQPHYPAPQPHHPAPQPHHPAPQPHHPAPQPHRPPSPPAGSWPAYPAPASGTGGFGSPPASYGGSTGAYPPPPPAARPYPAGDSGVPASWPPPPAEWTNAGPGHWVPPVEAAPGAGHWYPPAPVAPHGATPARAPRGPQGGRWSAPRVPEAWSRVALGWRDRLLGGRRKRPRD